MTALIKANPGLPAHIQQLAGLAAATAANELSGGVLSSFPIISYKGKVWRLRKGGEEELFLDAQGNALPMLNVVLVQANPVLSKIFYDKKYEEGVNDAPRCFSNDGVYPDPGVQDPIHDNCAACPNNVWGSRITDNGKKSRACGDSRRMAVVLADDLMADGDKCDKFLLRVPPASLNPLKDYAEKVLAPKGVPFFAVVTTISFDPHAAHPQMMFRAARFLNEHEASLISQLRGSEDLRRILSEAIEFPTAGVETGATAAAPAAAPAAPQRPVAAPAPATTPAPAVGKPRAARRPAEEEEAGADFLNAPVPPVAAPAPARAAAPAQVLTPPAAPTAAPKARRPRPPAAAAPAPAPAPVAAPAAMDAEEEEIPVGTAAVPAAAEDFSNLLDSILNT